MTMSMSQFQGQQDPTDDTFFDDLGSMDYD